MNYSRQREVILNIVKNTTSHPTAEWVYNEAKKQIPSIGIATVYRNLNALVESGDFRRIEGARGLDRFDGNVEPHFHMECESCGKLVDLPPANNESVDALKKMIVTTFEVEEDKAKLPTVLLTGKCRNCG